MNSDPDQILNRLVVTALTVFIAASLLMTAFVFREIWLQQRLAALNATLQVNLEELEQTTEEIQTTVSEIEATSSESQETQELVQLLETVDEQLATIGENIDEASTVRETETETSTVEAEAAEPLAMTRRQADQVFTIFALLTGIAAIAIAVLLGMALRVQDSRIRIQQENGS